MKGTAMTKNESKALQRSGSIEGMDGLDQSDAVMPRYKITQPTSAEVVDGKCGSGVFYCNLSGASYEEITITPLVIGKSRVWFEEGKDKPSCKSHDAMVPNVDQPHNDVCARRRNGRTEVLCPLAEWRNDSPPPCRLVYNLLALDLDHGEMPFILNLKGKSVRSAKQLISWLMLRRLSPFALQARMTLQLTRNDFGKFYVMDLVDMQQVDPPDKYRDRFLELRGVEIGDVETQGATDVEDDDIPF
jgi:hypothetical protein